MSKKNINKSMKFKPEEEYLLKMTEAAHNEFSKAVKIIIKEWHDMKTNPKPSEEEGSTKEMLERLLKLLENGNLNDSLTIKDAKKKVMLDIETSEL